MKINPYLNFPGNTEEAFNFYRSVFGGEFSAVNRFSENPEADNMAEEMKKQIMHIALPVSDDTLMASDAPTQMGFKVNFGNNIYLNVQPDSLEQGRAIFDKLADGGTVEMDLQKMFWGDYYGTLKDKYGVCWMVNYSPKQ